MLIPRVGVTAAQMTSEPEARAIAQQVSLNKPAPSPEEGRNLVAVLLVKLGGKVTLTWGDLLAGNDVNIVHSVQPSGDIVLAVEERCGNCGAVCVAKADNSLTTCPNGCDDPAVPDYVKEAIKRMAGRTA